MYEFEDFVEQSQQAKTLEDAWKLLHSVTQHNGYANLLFIQMKDNGHIDVPYRQLPDGYDDLYVTNKWQQIDPVLHQTLTSAVPFLWEDIVRRQKLKRVQKQFLEDCRALGVHSGYTIPIHSPGRRDIISMSVRDTIEVNRQRLPLLHAMVHQTWLRTAELIKPAQVQDSIVNLTSRERSCLYWIKEGKTYEDIGEILHMSPNTVDSHLRSARKKLSVSNTLTAVVKAIQLGLL